MARVKRRDLVCPAFQSLLVVRCGLVRVCSMRVDISDGVLNFLVTSWQAARPGNDTTFPEPLVQPCGHRNSILRRVLFLLLRRFTESCAHILPRSQPL
jgi:hypothetical protein